MSRFWLMKSEPDVFSIDDLRRLGRSPWDGVRNYQARNYMRDDMRVGDLALFYHSNAQPPGVAGLVRISRVGLPDQTALDPESKYFDPKATPDDPRWWMVEVEHVETFPRFVPLAEIREHPALQAMPLVRRSRLSVQPVEADEMRIILSLAGARTWIP